eukprot:848521_1
MVKKVTLLSCILLLHLTVTTTTRQYVYKTTPATWNDARVHCETFYDGLATILTSNEFDHATNRVSIGDGTQRIYIWIGLNDLYEEGIWQWNDGSVCDDNGGTHDCSAFWGLNEPRDGTTSNCGQLRYGWWVGDTSWSWGINDHGCASKFPFLCNSNTSSTYSNITTAPTRAPITYSNITTAPTRAPTIWKCNENDDCDGEQCINSQCVAADDSMDDSSAFKACLLFQVFLGVFATALWM